MTFLTTSRPFPPLLLALIILAGTAGMPLELHAGAPYRWPLSSSTHVTSTFGEYRPGHIHDGIDLSTGNTPGRAVHAVDTGVLERMFYDPAKYGKTLVIRHADGTRSWYSHLRGLAGPLRERFPRKLEPFTSRKPARTLRIRRGEIIARTGETGSGVHHLHFSLQRPDGSFVNPIGRFEPALPFEPDPHIDSVQLFPLDGRSWVNGGARSLTLGSRRDDPLSLWGTLGLDVTVWNHHGTSPARTVPSTIRVLRDGRLLAERRFDVLSDTSTGRFRNVYNERLSNLGPTQFTLHVTPGSDGSTWSGIAFTDEGETGTLTVEIQTATGRVARRRFSYRSRPPAFVRAAGESVNDRQTTSRTPSGDPTLRFASLRLDDERDPSRPTASRGASSAPRLATGWINNRLRVDLRVPGGTKEPPSLRVRQDDFRAEPAVRRVSRDHYVAWWNPALDRDGWHSVRMSFLRDGHRQTLNRRVYVQSILPGKPGAIVSLDGRYSLFNRGEGLKYPSFVQIRPTPNPTEPVDELALLEAPRRIQPRTLRSNRSLQLAVNLPESVPRPDRVGLYVHNPVTDGWEPLSYRRGLTSTSRNATVSGGRLVALMVDRRAPRIGSPRYHPGSNRVLVPVEESGSGLVSSDVRVTEDGSPLPVRWNVDRQRVEIPVPNGRSHLDLTLRIRDRAGNSNQWEGRVGTGP